MTPYKKNMRLFLEFSNFGVSALCDNYAILKKRLHNTNYSSFNKKNRGMRDTKVLNETF